MAKNLVLVESPTKAKTIKKMLGSNYQVMATVGHLRDLPKSKMGVDIEDDFNPQYINVRGKAPLINEIKKAYKNSDHVFLATDPDREGEAISWHVCNLLGIDPHDKNRVEFPEITKDTVREAIKKPRSIDMKLVDAQQARRVMDRIMGYSLSPILWKKVKNGLSAGRVQSVALKLICDREEEIRNFVKEEYWSITSFHEEKDKVFEASLIYEIIDQKNTKLTIASKKEADDILNKISKEFKVVDIKKTKKSKNPYPPYTTSTLQQDAYRKLGFTTSKTMMVAQQLYEGINIGKKGTVGLITYMRTDSTRISDICIKESLCYIHKTFGKEYATKGRSYGKNKKGAQDAHEAIRPSSIYNIPLEIQSYLTQDQYKLYRLIWDRVIASQMASCKYLSTRIDMINTNYLFRANGTITVFDGFTKVYSLNDKDVELPNIQINDVIEATKIEKKQHFTKPKPRYTEASLVKTLEEDGIGRPSTYSSIVSSIIKRNYVEIKEKKFYTTEIGEKVNTFLSQYFPDIINENFTARMEDELDKIAEDNYDWKKLLQGFYGTLEDNLSKAKKSSQDFKLTDAPVGRKCPSCGGDLIYKHGRNGKFIGCSNFPECKHTETIIKDTGVECPECKGRLVEKVSKRGKLFYGCENYPTCNFAVWDKPLKERCPECGGLLVHKKNRRTDEITCINEKCDYKKLNK